MMKVIYYLNSLLFCLRYLPFKQAVKIPILVWPDVKINTLSRGDIIFTGEIKRATVLLGFVGAKGRDTHPMYISVEKGSHLYLGNDINLARGTRIVLSDNANMRISDGFFCNANCAFYSNRDITINEKCLFGWNIELNTTDGHKTIVDGVENASSGPITLERHVWLCSDTIVSKNVYIAENCVVARRSVVTKSFKEANVLIGGIPAKFIKHNVTWIG